MVGYSRSFITSATLLVLFFPPTGSPKRGFGTLSLIPRGFLTSCGSVAIRLTYFRRIRATQLSSVNL